MNGDLKLLAEEAAKENIYMCALYFAFNKDQAAFRYREMINHLESKGWEIQDTFEKKCLFPWFLTTFASDGYYEHNVSVMMGDSARHSLYKESYLFFNTDRGYFKLIEYLEMKQAVNNAKSSSLMALWAIGISLFIGIIQVIVAIFST